MLPEYFTSPSFTIFLSVTIICTWNIFQVTGVIFHVQFLLLQKVILCYYDSVYWLCLYISILIIVAFITSINAIIILSAKQRRKYLEAEIKPLADSLKWNLCTTSLQKCILSYAIFIIWIDTSYENNLIVCSPQPLFNEFLTIWGQAVGELLLNFIFALRFSSLLLHLFRNIMRLTFSYK